MKCTRDHERWITKLRGNGFSQAEIGQILGLSQQVVAHNLGKMKERFKNKTPPLVVFYSRTGNTKKVGELIAQKLNCNTEETATKISGIGTSSGLDQ